MSNDELRKLKLTKTSADDIVAFIQQRRVRYDPDNDVWEDGYRDPVAGGTVSFLPPIWGHHASRVARLYYQLALTYWLSASEISRMAQIAAFGVDPLVDEYDDELTQINQRIEQAREDQERLRQLRQQGGSLEEIVEIVERTHEGLRWQMRVDPAHADEIAAALRASQERIRQMVAEHRRAVRQQRVSGGKLC
jgi:hypothetical protein